MAIIVAQRKGEGRPDGIIKYLQCLKNVKFYNGIVAFEIRLTGFHCIFIDMHYYYMESICFDESRNLIDHADGAGFSRISHGQYAIFIAYEAAKRAKTF